MNFDPYNIAYGLTLLAYLIHDVLWLRLILLGAHTGFLVLSIIHLHEPGLIWNPLFIAINLYHIAKLAWARRKIILPPDLEQYYPTVFATLSRALAKTWWDLGTDKAWNKVALVHDGDHPGELIFILGGDVDIQKAGTKVSSLGPGRFAAEMSYLTGAPASADVLAPGEVRCRVWPYEVLEKIRHKDPDFYSGIQGVLGRELAQKVMLNNAKKAKQTEAS